MLLGSLTVMQLAESSSHAQEYARADKRRRSLAAKSAANSGDLVALKTQEHYNGAPVKQTWRWLAGHADCYIARLPTTAGFRMRSTRGGWPGTFQ
jgi:hypothetical protein